MNKHIKKIIEILGNKPSHSQSEEVVYFSSKKFYNKFIEENPVEVWDYQDI